MESRDAANPQGFVRHIPRLTFQICNTEIELCFISPHVQLILEAISASTI